MKTRHMENGKAAIHALHQRGASLLEGIAYLGVAAIVILGAISLLTGAFSSALTNRAAEELVAVRTAVKKLYMGQSATYGNNVSLVAELVAAQSLPASLAVTAGNPPTVANAWNGAVMITGTGGAFAISYAQVPRDVCINLLASSSGWRQIVVDARPAITQFPISPGTATGECAPAASTIVWTSA